MSFAPRRPFISLFSLSVVCIGVAFATQAPSARAYEGAKRPIEYTRREGPSSRSVTIARRALSSRWGARDVSATERAAAALRRSTFERSETFKLPKRFRTLKYPEFMSGKAHQAFGEQDQRSSYEQYAAFRKLLGKDTAVVKPWQNGYLITTESGVHWRPTQPEAVVLVASSVRESKPGARVAILETPHDDAMKFTDAVRARSGLWLRSIHLSDESAPHNRPTGAENVQITSGYQGEALVSVRYGAETNSIFDFTVARPKNVVRDAWERFIGKVRVRLEAVLTRLSPSNLRQRRTLLLAFRAPSVADVLEDEIRKIAREEGIELESIRTSVRVGTSDLHISLDVHRSLLGRGLKHGAIAMAIVRPQRIYSAISLPPPYVTRNEGI